MTIVKFPKADLMRKSCLISLAVLAAACSPQVASEPAPASGTAGAAADNVTFSGTHPVSGLEVIPLSVETPDGPHTFHVEVALTPNEQARGLMFREEMGPDEGMIFLREENPHVASFWMKNTPLPLDIIFIDADRRIINIAANTEPFSEQPVRSMAPAASVLELNGGRAAELGIVPGAKVDW